MIVFPVLNIKCYYLSSPQRLETLVGRVPSPSPLFPIQSLFRVELKSVIFLHKETFFGDNLSPYIVIS